jgi:hypothetical protein
MKRAVSIGVLLVVIICAGAAFAAWAYQNQVWLRDDYSAGYTYGSTLSDATASDTRRERGAVCWERAQAHSASESAQVVFQGGCTDAGNGRESRPEAAGDIVSDLLGLWGPFG